MEHAASLGFFYLDFLGFVEGFLVGMFSTCQNTPCFLA